MTRVSTAWMVVHDIKDSIAFNVPYYIKKRNYGKRTDYTFKDGSILSVYPWTSKAITRNSEGLERFTFPLKINK